MTEFTPVPRWFCLGCKRVVPEGEVNDHARHTGLVSTPARGYSLDPCMGMCALPIDGSILYYDALYQQYNRFFPADKTIRLGVVPSDFWPDGLTYEFNRSTDAYTILGGGGVPSATNLPSLKAVKLRAMEMFQSKSEPKDAVSELDRLRADLQSARDDIARLNAFKSKAQGGLVMLDRIEDLMCVQLEEWHEGTSEDLHDCIARVIRERSSAVPSPSPVLSRPADAPEVTRCRRCDGTGVLLDISSSPSEGIPCDSCDGRSFEAVAWEWCDAKVSWERTAIADDASRCAAQCTGPANAALTAFAARIRDAGASKVAAALSHPAADLAAQHMGARYDSSGGYEVCLSPSAVPGPSPLPGRCPRCNGTGVLLDTSVSPAEDVPCDRCDGRTFERVAADWCADKVAQERERCLQEVRKTNWSLSCLSDLEDRIIRGSK